MQPVDAFLFCPRCGERATTAHPRYFDCLHCTLRFYFNVTVAAVGLILNESGQLFVIRRAREPALGKLAMPGGFVDPEESAEEALRREIQEEVGLEVTEFSFLLSHPNTYPYRGLSYSVCDLFFLVRVAGGAATLAPDEVSAALWVDPYDLDIEELAFPSMRAALLQYRCGNQRDHRTG